MQGFLVTEAAYTAKDITVLEGLEPMYMLCLLYTSPSPRD